MAVYLGSNQVNMRGGQVNSSSGGTWHDVDGLADANVYARENGSVLLITLEGFNFDEYGDIGFPESVSSVVCETYGGFSVAYDSAGTPLALYTSPNGVGRAFGDNYTDVYGSIIVPITDSPSF